MTNRRMITGRAQELAVEQVWSRVRDQVCDPVRDSICEYTSESVWDKAKDKLWYSHGYGLEVFLEDYFRWRGNREG